MMNQHHHHHNNNNNNNDSQHRFRNLSARKLRRGQNKFNVGEGRFIQDYDWLTFINAQEEEEEEEADCCRKLWIKLRIR